MNKKELSQYNKTYYKNHKKEITIRKKKYYKINLDKIKKNYKIYSLSKNGKKKIYDSVKRYRKKFPEKRKCRHKLQRLFINGNINNNEFSCALCNKQPIEKHHENYNEPFVFIPLCINHHNEIHNKEI
jgi:hypothetical protein